MVEPVSISGFGFFMPIFAFLLVFVLVYALLSKAKILGENNFVPLLISFILAIFFVVEVSLVEFVQFSSAWFVVFLVSVFLILILIGLTHGKLDVLQKPWVAWILIVIILGLFIVSSAYVFNWAVNWDKVSGWFSTDWFGLVLLLAIAGVASWIISKK